MTIFERTSFFISLRSFNISFRCARCRTTRRSKASAVATAAAAVPTRTTAWNWTWYHRSAVRWRSAAPPSPPMTTTTIQPFRDISWAPPAPPANVVVCVSCPFWLWVRMCVCVCARASPWLDPQWTRRVRTKTQTSQFPIGIWGMRVSPLPPTLTTRKHPTVIVPFLGFDHSRAMVLNLFWAVTPPDYSQTEQNR